MGDCPCVIISYTLLCDLLLLLLNEAAYLLAEEITEGGHLMLQSGPEVGVVFISSSKNTSTMPSTHGFIMLIPHS